MSALAAVVAGAGVISLVVADGCIAREPPLYRAEGSAMEPALADGDIIAVVPLEEDEPKRGDVVVFRSPRNEDRTFIKRVIGLPGDHIVIDRVSKTFSLNGELQAEPYVKGVTTCPEAPCDWIVPEGEYFVMGDNRQNSSDSRQGWFVPRGNIIGQAARID